MSELKELKRLKDEERTLMNVASKLSDQLNRLKVEELALLSMLHKEVLPSQVEIAGKEDEGKETQPSSSQPAAMETEELVPLDLSVTGQQQRAGIEEEEEEEEEDDDLTMMMTEI